MTHLGFTLATVFAMLASQTAMAQFATPLECDDGEAAVSTLVLLPEEHAAPAPVDEAALLKIDGVSPGVPDSTGTPRRIMKPFSPMTILSQVVVGTMGTAVGGAIGALLAREGGFYLGLPAGMAVGVLLGGAGSGGPGTVPSFFVSLAGSVAGYSICAGVDRLMNGDRRGGLSLTTYFASSLTTSILFYYLLATFDSEARVDTPPPAQTNNRNDIPETWRDNTLYSVPILPPDMWLVPVLTVRF